MKKNLARWALDVWYKDAFPGVLLRPLGYLFSGVVRFRRFVYVKGLKKSVTLPIPVIVVGNITLGGTGKTPLVIWLARLLKENGYKPGIISRGYGSKSTTWPLIVKPESDAIQTGDEPLLIARQTQMPVVIGPSRIDAAKLLLAEFDCDVIISDDGLQHYKLNRDIEIAVVDGERQFGNGHCLPAGPLREPIDRLGSVDFVIVNGKKNAGHEFEMQLTGEIAINLKTGESRALMSFKHTPCHAVAGIGNPERFFKLLYCAGLNCNAHSFPDHHYFKPEDFAFADDNSVLMTEKDAVKCTGFAKTSHWFVPVEAALEPEFKEKLLNLLSKKSHDR